MKQIRYSNPETQSFWITDKNILELYNDMIGNYPVYWERGIRSVMLEFFNDGVLTERLTVGFHIEYGLSLTYEIV